MKSGNHILLHEGILTSFSISKTVTNEDIRRLKDLLNGNNVSEEIFDKMLNQMIQNDARESFENKQVPGMLFEKIISDEQEKKIFMELTYLATQISKKIESKQMDSYHKCYTINALVNLLGLKDEDFDEFYRKFTKFKEGLSEPE